MTESSGADPARRRLGGIDAVTVLTVYLVLLLAAPSSYAISALGSVGKPAGLWALGASLWWAASRVQRFVPSRSDARAVKIGIFAFGGAVLVSYAVAMLRGLPPEEVSPADSSILRLVGWIGIALVASDGIDDRDRFRTLLRRLVIAGTLMAILGLLQFVTGQSLLDWVSIPGFSSDVSGLAGVQSRGGFVRASGTAIHPLEYGMVLCVAFPIAVSLALGDSTRARVPRWLPVFIIGAASMLAVSRSTLVGLAAGIVLLVPGWSRRVKLVFAIVSAFAVAAIGVLVPGMVGTLRGLFLGIGGDASTGSRVAGIDSTADILARFPVSGKGFGTFLPVYHILDNQYLLLTIETGILGLVTFLALVSFAVWSAWKAKRLLSDPLDRALVQSVLASTVAAAVLLAFFDGFSFPMSAGLMFLLIGLCGGALRLAILQQRADAIRMPRPSPAIRTVS
jgi:O-antigen ligase